MVVRLTTAILLGYWGTVAVVHAKGTQRKDYHEDVYQREFSNETTEESIAAIEGQSTNEDSAEDFTEDYTDEVQTTITKVLPDGTKKVVVEVSELPPDLDPYADPELHPSRQPASVISDPRFSPPQLITQTAESFQPVLDKSSRRPSGDDEFEDEEEFLPPFGPSAIDKPRMGNAPLGMPPGGYPSDDEDDFGYQPHMRPPGAVGAPRGNANGSGLSKQQLEAKRRRDIAIQKIHQRVDGRGQQLGKKNKP